MSSVLWNCMLLGCLTECALAIAEEVSAEFLASVLFSFGLGLEKDLKMSDCSRLMPEALPIAFFSVFRGGWDLTTGFSSTWLLSFAKELFSSALSLIFDLDPPVTWGLLTAMFFGWVVVETGNANVGRCPVLRYVWLNSTIYRIPWHFAHLDPSIPDCAVLRASNWWVFLGICFGYFSITIG